MRPKERKQQIIECAKRLFSKKGFYETQIIDIVKELRISKGNPYQYFKNKEDLFLQMIDHIYHQWLEFKVPDDKIKTPNTPYNYLHNKIAKIIYFFDWDIDSANILIRIGPGINRSIEPFIEKMEHTFIESIKRDLRAGQRIKAIEKDADVELLSYIILGVVSRVSYYYLIKRRVKNVSVDLDGLVDKIASSLAVIYLKGYAPPGIRQARKRKTIHKKQ
jgi:AcrR family transcriptional regulator